MNAVRDGEVVGCRVGIVDGAGCYACDIEDPRGERVRLKLEGIESMEEPESTDVLRFAVVADMDRPDFPALIGRLELALPSL